MDELKKYLQQNRERLDIDEPGGHLLSRINEKVEQPEKINSVVALTKWAAAACIIGLAGWGLVRMVDNKKENISATTVTHSNRTAESVTADRESNDRVNITKMKPNIILLPKKHNPKKEYPVYQEPYVSASELSELSELENSFTQVIELQQARISSMPMNAESPEYFNDFKVQIRQMEKDEKHIKSDIMKHGVSDELLNRLINLYQQRLNTLKQLQIEMNKTNNRYKQNHSPVDSSKIYFIQL